MKRLPPIDEAVGILDELQACSLGKADGEG
jgi:hypothetical protein